MMEDYVCVYSILITDNTDYSKIGIITAEEQTGVAIDLLYVNEAVSPPAIRDLGFISSSNCSISNNCTTTVQGYNQYFISNTEVAMITVIGTAATGSYELQVKEVEKTTSTLLYVLECLGLLVVFVILFNYTANIMFEQGEALLAKKSNPDDQESEKKSEEKLESEANE